MSNQYNKIYLFGKKESRGSFDDFYSTEKYDSIQSAYENNDYIECDFVKDEGGTIFIEARNVKSPEVKKYHRLNFQHCPFGIDALDDSLAVQMATTLF